MRDFLKSIKLVRESSVTLNCSRSYFLKILAENTRHPGLEVFEAFTSGPPFKGTVGVDQFRIRQRQQGMMSNRQYMVNVRGAVAERDDKVLIAMEANGFNRFIGAFFLLFILAFTGAVIAMITSSAFPLVVLPFALVQIALVLLLPYMMLRRAVKNTPREFEKEFHFLIRDYKG